MYAVFLIDVTCTGGATGCAWLQLEGLLPGGVARCHGWLLSFPAHIVLCPACLVSLAHQLGT